MSGKYEREAFVKAIEAAGFEVRPAVPGGLLWWFRKASAPWPAESGAKRDLGGPFLSEPEALINCAMSNDCFPPSWTETPKDAAPVP